MTRPISNAGCARGKTAAGGHKHEYLNLNHVLGEQLMIDAKQALPLQRCRRTGSPTRNAQQASHSALPMGKLVRFKPNELEAWAARSSQAPARRLPNDRLQRHAHPDHNRRTSATPSAKSAPN
jgi:hypothetical protein